MSESSDSENEVEPSTVRNMLENNASGYVCDICGVRFSRRYNRDRHVILAHNNVVPVHDCSFCGAVFDSGVKMREHRERHKPTTGFEERQSAYRKKCVILRKKYNKKKVTFENAFNEDKLDMIRLLKYEVGNRNSLKTGIIYHAEFIRLSPQIGGANENAEEESEDDQVEQSMENDQVEQSMEDAVETMRESNTKEDGDEEEFEIEDNEAAKTIDMSESRYEICLRAPSVTLTLTTNVANVVHNAARSIQNRIDDFVENGSGWRLNQILYVDVELQNCSPLNGSCNLISVKYLKSLKSIKVCKDLQECFLHACAYHFVKKADPLKLNKFIKKYFICNITSPVNVKDIPKFEKSNAHLKLKINVIFQDGKKIFPLLFSKNTKAKHHITLLLYKTKLGKQAINHYTYVSDVDKFLRKCYSRNGNVSYQKTIYCQNCFSTFEKSKNGNIRLEKHYTNCLKNEPQAVKIPQKGDVIKFKQHINKFQSYFVGFFDFESRHVKQKYECDKCQKISEDDDVECNHQTLVKFVQEPITYSYIILNKHGTIVFKKTYTGDDCVKKFLEELISIETDLLQILNKNEILHMSARDETVFATQTKCHICNLELLEDRVRDHCHISGDFLGAAHTICNLQRVERNSIPMFCHNLSGYDGHFLMQHFGGLKGVKHLSALPYNTEKFRTIDFNCYQLKDSLSFLNTSLNELMNNLLSDTTHKFEIIDQLGLYSTDEKEKKQLILRKGIYPYEFVTSIKKLRHTKTIPKKKHFFSTLTNSGVSEEDYEHSKKVFGLFGCRDLVDYTELYCAMDVGILAEVFSAFRKLVQNNFNLDCCHYISTPQMSFDCMLQLTKVEIELMHDVDQILFIEQNIRGGVSYINTRHCVEETTKEQRTELKFIDGMYLMLKSFFSHILRFIFSSQQPLWSSSEPPNANK